MAYLVDEPAAPEVVRRLPGLVEVEGDQGVDAEADVVGHPYSGAGQVNMPHRIQLNLRRRVGRGCICFMTLGRDKRSCTNNQLTVLGNKRE